MTPRILLSMVAQGTVCALLLGSWYGFAVALLLDGMFVVRTVMEERTLRAELAGYADYARTVRYRIIPGVW